MRYVWNVIKKFTVVEWFVVVAVATVAGAIFNAFIYGDFP